MQCLAAARQIKWNLNCTNEVDAAVFAFPASCQTLSTSCATWCTHWHSMKVETKVIDAFVFSPHTNSLTKSKIQFSEMWEEACGNTPEPAHVSLPAHEMDTNLKIINRCARRKVRNTSSRSSINFQLFAFNREDESDKSGMSESGYSYILQLTFFLTRADRAPWFFTSSRVAGNLEQEHQQ